MSKNNPATAPTAALKTQIIIVGGGAGGLELAAKLGAKYGRKRHDIILVERNRTHIWKPLLRRGGRLVRSTPTSTRSAIAVTATAGDIASFTALSESIDRKSRQITVAPLLDEDGSELIGRHSIRFDYLVLAVGSVTNDFSIHGVRENCLFLDDRAGADRFRDKLLNHCLRRAHGRPIPKAMRTSASRLLAAALRVLNLLPNSTTRLEPCVITDSKYSMKSGSWSRWSKRGRASCRRFPIGSPRRRNMSSRRSAYAC